METRYLYEIRPVKPITINGRMTRVPCSVNLTKEEAKDYMRSANLYRRFGADTLIKVTGANIDFLHVSKYEALNSGIITISSGEINLGIKVENKEEKITKEFKENKEEPVNEDSEVIIDDEKISDDMEQNDVESDDINENDSASVDTEEIATEAQIPNVDVATEPKTEAPVASNNTVVINSSNHQNNNYQNYNKKNNKNRNHR